MKGADLAYKGESGKMVYMERVSNKPYKIEYKVFDDIHKIGGSFLGTSRGGGDRVNDICDAIESLSINMLFIIGGDGTQRGALEVSQEAARRGLKVAIVGIPKTVDNDLLFLDRSFGFETAVQKAKEAVTAVHMEAHSQVNGIGLVKLMGRDSGFIAAATTLASHETNFCLIPEVPFDLDGPNGFLAHLEDRIRERHHAVFPDIINALPDQIFNSTRFHQRLL